MLELAAYCIKFYGNGKDFIFVNIDKLMWKNSVDPGYIEPVYIRSLLIWTGRTSPWKSYTKLRHYCSNLFNSCWPEHSIYWTVYCAPGSGFSRNGAATITFCAHRRVSCMHLGTCWQRWCCKTAWQGVAYHRVMLYLLSCFLYRIIGISNYFTIPFEFNISGVDCTNMKYRTFLLGTIPFCLKIKSWWLQFA